MPNVLTQNTSTSNTTRSVRRRTYRIASTSWPRCLGSRVTRCSRVGSIANSPAMTATKLIALLRNTQPVPTNVIITPATAGPTTRARLNVIELSATALVTCSEPTISPTNDCRIGASIAVKQPSTKQNRYTCHSATIPVTSSSPRTSAQPPMPACRPSSSRRLSIRSASMPAHIDNIRVGRNWSAAAMPRAIRAAAGQL